MGVEFNLEHASIVGWLTQHDFPFSDVYADYFLWDKIFYYHHIIKTSSVSGDYGDSTQERWKAPRAKKDLIKSLLEALPDSYISSSEPNRNLFRRLIKLCWSRYWREAESIQSDTQQATVFSPEQVARILAPLRAWFISPFYFLVLGHESNFRELAYETPDYTLWLYCKDTKLKSNDLLDPFPKIGLVATAKDNESNGILCWNPSGESFYISPEKADLQQLIFLSRNLHPKDFWMKLKSFDSKLMPSFQILHLSDLHFGLKNIDLNCTHVEQHLRSVIDEARKNGTAIQPVITGDLTDSPSDENLRKFEGFRNRLTDYSQAEVIVIPGNHDMRKKGFFWREWEVIAGLEWNSVLESEVSKTIFLCFNTALNAKFARGKIEKQDLVEMNVKLTELERRRIGENKDRIRIALVHHHPFSSQDDELDTIYGFREEPFVRMTNGEELIKWCAKMNVPLILHGHKHKPRFVGKEEIVNNKTRMVRSIGCGTTMGAEGRPLSYNLITWNPTNRTWSVSFFADRDGSGFEEKRLAVGENYPS